MRSAIGDRTLDCWCVLVVLVVANACASGPSPTMQHAATAEPPRPRLVAPEMPDAGQEADAGAAGKRDVDSETKAPVAAKVVKAEPTGSLRVAVKKNADDPLVLALPNGRLTLLTQGGQVVRELLAPVGKFPDVPAGVYVLNAALQCQEPFRGEVVVKAGQETVFEYPVAKPEARRRFVTDDFRGGAFPSWEKREAILPALAEVLVERTWPDENGKCAIAIINVVDGKGMVPVGSRWKIYESRLVESPVAGLSAEQYLAREKAAEAAARAAAVNEVRAGKCTPASKKKYQALLGQAVESLEYLNRIGDQLLVLQDQQIVVIGEKGKSLSFTSSGASVLHVLAMGDVPVSVDLKTDAGRIGGYDPQAEQIRSSMRLYRSQARALRTNVGDEVRLTLKGYGCAGLMVFSSVQ